MVCLSDFPVVDKTTLLSNFDTMLSATADRKSLVSEFTSGSSGTCFECLKSKKELLLAQMIVWKLRTERASDILRRRLLVFASSVDLPSGLRYAAAPSQPKDNLDGYYGRLDYVHLTPRDLQDSPLANILSFVERSRPEWIRSTPSNAYCFAKRLEHYDREDVHTAFRSVKFLEVTGEVLEEHERDTIISVFGVPVVNMYGMREVWPIAYECKHGTMHLVSEHVHIEALPAPDLPDGTGEACLTALRQFEFPFIRYRTGDIITTRVDICECGRSGMLIDKVVGRRNRMLRVDGQLMSSQVFSQMFKTLASSGVLRADGFRVVQTAPRSFNILVASTHGVSSEATHHVCEFLDMHVALDLDVSLTLVDRFPPCYDDKHFFFYSEIADFEE